MSGMTNIYCATNAQQDTEKDRERTEDKKRGFIHS